MLFHYEASWILFWFNAACYALFVLIREYVDMHIPARWLNPSGWLFRIRPWERGGDFYRDFLGIDRWKSKLPSLRGRTNFSKKHLEGSGPGYLERFIIETCRSESNHMRAILSVVFMKLWTPFGLWLLCLVLAVVGNLPFICIQRYNRPRLQRLAALEERRAALRQRNAASLTRELPPRELSPRELSSSSRELAFPADPEGYGAYAAGT